MDLKKWRWRPSLLGVFFRFYIHFLCSSSYNFQRRQKFRGTSIFTGKSSSLDKLERDHLVLVTRVPLGNVHYCKLYKSKYFWSVLGATRAVHELRNMNHHGFVWVRTNSMLKSYWCSKRMNIVCNKSVLTTDNKQWMHSNYH